jgi:hypothetical protein
MEVLPIQRGRESCCLVQVCGLSSSPRLTGPTTEHGVRCSHAFLLTVESAPHHTLNSREERRKIDSPFTPHQRFSLSLSDGQTDGVVTGHARSADSENVGTRAHARLGHHPSNPADYRRGAPGAAGRTLSRTQPARASRLNRGEMGRQRRRPWRQVLHADAGRTFAAGARVRAVASAVVCGDDPARYRVDHHDRSRPPSHRHGSSLPAAAANRRPGVG